MNGTNWLITAETGLNIITCPDCAGTFAISKDYMNEASRLGNFKKCWTCPYCKAERGYGEGKIQELEKQLSEKENSLQWERQRAEVAAREAAHFRKSRDTIAGLQKSLKLRLSKGVCPCCHRHFRNIEAHMKNKHPRFNEPHEKA